MQANELYKAGKIQEAIEAQIAEVKAKPADHNRRLFLFELLAFAGDLERAKKHIEVMEFPEMELMAAVTSYRRLLDSEEARRNLYKNGIAPMFFAEVPDHVHVRLEALSRLRENKQAEAAELLAKAHQLTPHLKGKLNDKPLDSFRDYDDLLSGVLEVMQGGNYYWVPLDQVEMISLAVPKTPRDLLWRSGRLEMPGSAGNIFVPVLYPMSHEHPDNNVKLGRTTEWKGPEEGPVLGLGLRVFRAGDDDVNILDIKELELEPVVPPEAQAAPA
jgi:type VI secretion system protein ImpE